MTKSIRWYAEGMYLVGAVCLSFALEKVRKLARGDTSPSVFPFFGSSVRRG